MVQIRLYAIGDDIVSKHHCSQASYRDRIFYSLARNDGSSESGAGAMWDMLEN